MQAIASPMTRPASAVSNFSCSSVLRAASAVRKRLPAVLPLAVKLHSGQAHRALKLCCSNATEAHHTSCPVFNFQVRQAQIRAGDREVYVTEEGDKMSKLKQVDDAWILRRLERWGRKASCLA